MHTKAQRVVAAVCNLRVMNYTRVAGWPRARCAIAKCKPPQQHGAFMSQFPIRSREICLGVRLTVRCDARGGA
eukprot:8397162-Lingulodinium_polyedra.AAC.1